jgi:hypothetical protein
MLIIQPATDRDLDKLVSFIMPLISCDGFHNIFCPRHDESPDDSRISMRRYNRDIILKPDSVIFFVEDDTIMWACVPTVFGLERGNRSMPNGLPELAKDSWFEIVFIPN